MKSISTKIGEIAIIFSAIAWGCIGIFTRNLQAIGFSPIQIAALRSIFTTLILFVAIMIINRKLLRIKLCDIWMFFGTGILSFLLMNVCYMLSISENSLSVSSILMYTSPIWVTVLSIFIFKEKLTAHKLISLSVCLFGCALVCLSKSVKLTGIGLVFGLLSGLTYALYSIFGKFAAKKYHALTISFYTFFFSAIGILPFCRLLNTVALLNNPKSLVFSLLIAIVSTALPFLLYTYGLSKTKAGNAAVLCTLEPIIAAIIGKVFFDEELGIYGIMGIFTVVGGLIYLEKNKKDMEKKA